MRVVRVAQSLMITSPNLRECDSVSVSIFYCIPGHSDTGVPTGCMLVLMSELYPLGPETAMLRALPPVEVHLTLNVDVPASTSIAAVTSVTGGEEPYRTSLTIYYERWPLTGVEDVQSY